MPLSGRHDLPLATFKKPKPLVSSLPRFVQRRLAVVQQLRDRQNLSIRRNGGKMRIIPAFFAYCRECPENQALWHIVYNSHCFFNKYCTFLNYHLLQNY